ncbi:hypothetical protein H2203_005309 [Taxawa tesnikishii (nom. ined.)]|nr:hypothetical protein H2203_005309 [Dothideales sp. JES 119]
MRRERVSEQFAHGTREQIGEEEIEEAEEELDSGLELQAGRTEKIGVQRYGVPVDIVQHLSMRSIKFFRQLSHGWHRFLGLASSDNIDAERLVESAKMACSASGPEKRLSPFIDGGSASKRPRRDDADYNTRGIGQLQPSAVTVSVEGSKTRVEEAMQAILGRRDVAFKPREQENAMSAILGGKTPLVVVLGTGGGKSLLFMVPAVLERSKVSIVVVPFRALLIDLKGRLREARIEHIEWSSGEVNPAPIVLVSADIAGSWGFLTYASLLSQKRLLQRVVVDECHLTYTASDYRPKLTQLKNLRALPCQMVLLTATQPPLLEPELAQSMLVQNAHYIRASTVRGNIRYYVQECARGKVVETAEQICKRRRRDVGGVGQWFTAVERKTVKRWQAGLDANTITQT